MIQITHDSQLGTLTMFPSSKLEEIKKEDITLITGKIKAGQLTDLDGFFSEEVIYLGIYEEQLQFKVGESKDLFDHDTWCNSFTVIDEETLTACYQAGTLRDFRWKKGEWR